MYKIVLFGNPNAGKSTLFNALTRSTVKVGNWHGVTVKESVAEFRLCDGEVCSVADLPGLYTLNGASAEEKISENYLRKGGYDLAVGVIEASFLPRAMRLVEEVKALGRKVVIFVNFYSEFSDKGGKLDLPALKNLFGGEVFVGEAERKGDVAKFKKVIEKALASPMVKSPAASDYKGVISLCGRKKSDDLFLSPLFIYPAFIFALLFSFWLAFGNYGLGSMIGGAISRLFDFFKVLVGKIPSGGGSGFLKDFVSEGVIGGVGAVAVFLPQIAILSACMEFTDRSGFTSRVAAATDGLLSAIGLNGKAVYALFCGFGCTAVAAAQAEGIDDPAVKRRAVLSLPFVSCAARTPVYAIIAKVCFPEHAPLVMTGIYLFSATLSLIHALLLFKTADKTPPAFLVTELAPMRLPSFSSLIRAALISAKNFAARIGTVVVLSSATVFILYGVTADFCYVAGGSEESLLSYIGRAFSILLRPAGIEDWRFSAALVSGLFAKESVASSLALLFPNGFYLAPAPGFALTVFFALYTPCFSALASISRAIGRKYAVLSAVWQLFISLAAAYATRFVCGFI